MTMLTPQEAYRRWAPTYDGETAVSFLENEIVRELRVPVLGNVLDVGCGTGRRLRDVRAGCRLVGVDASTAMLQRASVDAERPRLLLAAADLRALPFAAASFDVVWCRLAIGHVAEIERAYLELSRVCRTGGWVVVSDFHPDAAAAGHRRTFRDGDGAVRAIEHHVHEVEQHLSCATRQRLSLRARRDGVVGPRLRAFYKRAGRMEAYEQQRGLRLVLALAFQRGRGT